MNKKETIKMAAQYAGISEKDMRKAVDAFLCTLSNALDFEEEVTIPDFGKFSVKECAPFKYRDPNTGEVKIYPARKRVRFKPYGNITNYYMKF